MRAKGIVFLVAFGVLAVGAGTAAAATKYPTVFEEFKFKASDGEREFKGQIGSPKGKCIEDRKTVAYRKKDGDDKKLDSDRTDGKGKFTIELSKDQAKDGKYYVEVKQESYGSGDDKIVCLDAKSPTIKITT